MLTPGSTARRGPTLAGSTCSRYVGALRFEQLDAGHRHHPHARPLAGKRPAACKRERDLRAGRDQDQLRRALARGRGIPQHVTAALELARLPEPLAVAIEHGDVLPGQQQRHRPVLAFERHPPGLRGLVRIAPGGSPTARGSRAAPRSARPAGASARPRRGRPSRASTPTPPAVPSAPTGAPTRACSRRTSGTSSRTV